MNTEADTCRNSSFRACGRQSISSIAVGTRDELGSSICSWYVLMAADSQQQTKEPTASRIGGPRVSFKFIQEQAPSGSVEVPND